MSVVNSEMAERWCHSKGEKPVVHMGDEFPTLQQKPKMTYRQMEGQQLPVKHAVLPLTVTKVPAEESQGLLGTVPPLLTHRPYSVIRSVGAFLPLRASYRGRIKWAETVVEVHQPEERLQAFHLTWLWKRW